MKIGCGTVVFREYELVRAMDSIRRAGFEYMETQAIPEWCPHVDIFRDDPVKFADLARNCGFLGVTALWMPDGALVSSEKSVTSGVQALKWAAAAGIPVVNACDGFKPDGMADGEALGIIARRLEKLLGEAEKVGVYLALEPRGSFSLTAEGLTELLALVDSPWLGINYDAANIRRESYAENSELKKAGEEKSEKDRDREKDREKPDEVAALEEVAERVVHFHAKDLDGDGVCVPLGEGEVKIAECVRLLGRYDYDGAVSLETEGGMPAEKAEELAKKSFVYLKKLIG